MSTEPASRLILASASPQRRAILKRLGVSFTVAPADIREISQGDPAEVALQNALSKAQAVHRPGADEIVLGVDTLVTIGGRIYGKPADEDGARSVLRVLAGATHTVLSGMALLIEGQQRTALSETRVSFRGLSERLLDWYLATGEWRERAGGYAIQGAGAALVRSIDGDYENVVGLPLSCLLDIYPDLLGT
ncbi:MAG: Maf family protein [Solirubrobacteraceae bacterium]